MADGGVALHNWAYVAVALAVLAVCVLLSYALSSGGGDGGGPHGRWQPSPRFQANVRQLVHEAAAWCAAARADTQTAPLRAALHAAYANAYLNTARKLAGDAAVEKLCGVRLDEMVAELSEAQAAALSAAGSACPPLALPNADTLRTGWLA